MSAEDIREKMGSLKERFLRHPEKAVAPDSMAVARLANEQLSVTVEGPSGFSVRSDMAKGIGGVGEAPTPGWFLRAGIASCTATAIAMRAGQLSVPIQGVEVKVESLSNNAAMFDIADGAPVGPLEATMSIEVKSEGTPKEVVEDIVTWAVEHSPVADALTRSVPLTVAVTIVE